MTVPRIDEEVREACHQVIDAEAPLLYDPIYDSNEILEVVASVRPKNLRDIKLRLVPALQGCFGNAHQLFVLLFQLLLHSFNYGLDIGVRDNIPGLGSVGHLVFPKVRTRVSLWGISRLLGSIECLEFLHRSNHSCYRCSIVRDSQQITNLGTDVLIVGLARRRIRVARVGRH